MALTVGDTNSSYCSMKLFKAMWPSHDVDKHIMMILKNVLISNMVQYICRQGIATLPFGFCNNLRRYNSTKPAFSRDIYKGTSDLPYIDIWASHWSAIQLPAQRLLLLRLGFHNDTFKIIFLRPTLNQKK